MKTFLAAVTLLVACHHNIPAPDAALVDSAAVVDAVVNVDANADAALPSASRSSSSTLTMTNATAADTVVYFAFGADSAITSWSFCPTTSRLNCQFPLKAKSTQVLPLAGKYLNATVGFGAAVACGTTKGELNLNNPTWYDIADVSLVDGYSNKIEIDIGTVKLGPPLGASGNEKVYGLFPLGCDICVARQSPPCGMKPGKAGCKTGPDQYHPDVICQWQGATKGGGSAVKVLYLGK